MNRYSYLFLIVVLVLLSGCKSQKELEQTDHMDLPNALLWQVEHKDIPETSYLFGTIHLIDSESFFWPNNTLSSLDKVEKVVFEIDVADLTDMGKLMGIFNKALMKNNTSLKDLYSAEDYNLVKNHFEAMGIPFMFMEKIKPMFLTVFAGEDMSSFDFQSGDVKSYELELGTLAEAKGLETGGLETIDMQIGIFDSIPYQVQADMLLESIKSDGGDNSELDEMIALYQGQNISKMVDYISNPNSGYAEFEDILLNDRNANWIPIIGSMMREKSTFFAVGAGHLAGNKGVLNLLRKQGYILTPLSL